MRQDTKKIDFSGQTLYVGIDVHRKDWKVSILSSSLAMLVIVN